MKKLEIEELKKEFERVINETNEKEISVIIKEEYLGGTFVLKFKVQDRKTEVYLMDSKNRKLVKVIEWWEATEKVFQKWINLIKEQYEIF